MESNLIELNGSLLLAIAHCTSQKSEQPSFLYRDSVSMKQRIVSTCSDSDVQSEDTKDLNRADLEEPEAPTTVVWQGRDPKVMCYGVHQL